MLKRELYDELLKWKNESKEETAIVTEGIYIKILTF